MQARDQVLLETKRFQVVRATHPDLPEREIIRHPGAVTILPLIDDERVCLIRNYRLSVDKTLIELPAGTLEPGESPIETARRELTEETGFKAEHMELLHSFYLSPGILDERMHLFLARGLTAGSQDLREDERIENFVVTLDDARAMIEDGRIQDAKTIIGLMYYDLRSPSA